MGQATVPPSGGQGPERGAAAAMSPALYSGYWLGWGSSHETLGFAPT
jgi:hypothetical protein